MPELGIPPEKIVFVTGIGCAGRFVYYMDTYGMHGIHGRAPALATAWRPRGRPVGGWSAGDGDALSIGGNHLIHALPQRAAQDPAVQQPDLRADQGPVLAYERGGQGHQVHAMFGRRTTRSIRSRWRSAPRRLRGAHGRHGQEARGRDAARGLRRTRARPSSRSTRTATFNDGAFDAVRAKGEKERNQIRLEHGQPIRSESRRSAESCAVPTGAWSWSTSRASARTPCSCTMPTGPSRASRSSWPTWPPDRPAPRRSGSSAPWSARSTEPSCRRRWKTRVRSQVGTPELEALLHSGIPGPSRRTCCAARSATSSVTPEPVWCSSRCCVIRAISRGRARLVARHRGGELLDPEAARSRSQTLGEQEPTPRRCQSSQRRWRPRRRRGNHA